MSEASERGDALRRKYGTPRRMQDREPMVMVFLHRSRESAEDFAEADREYFGHPASVEAAERGWLTVVDLRHFLARQEEDARV